MLDRNKIKEAFKNNKIKIKSSDKNGNVEYKDITDVLRHFSIAKDIYEIVIDNDIKVIVTEDHSLFTFENNELKLIKPVDNPTEILFLENDKLVLKIVKSINKIDKREYMYDLSVEDNENFVLTSGILVHNSFSPPSSEQTIAGFTRTRGYRWPDEQLYFHLVQALNYINLMPPDTSFDLRNIPAEWQSVILLQAMIYALWDLSILWINEEFNYSLNGISLDISRSDKYSGAAQALQSQVDTQLTTAKSRIHLIRGLRQSRYTFSYGAALGPWVSSKMSIKKWVIGSRAGRGFY